MNVGNCPHCGKLYALNVMGCCPTCLREIEQQYVDCAEYLRKHRGANVQELSDETGVSIKQITRFIKEGRISVVDAPNLMLPCEVCGTFIREGHMCESCRSRLSKDLSSAAREVSQGEGRSLGAGAYRAIDKSGRS